jgi:hypothetical protein
MEHYVPMADTATRSSAAQLTRLALRGYFSAARRGRDTGTAPDAVRAAIPGAAGVAWVPRAHEDCC